MSSFEPLFAGPGNARLAPRVAAPATVSGAWTPRLVGPPPRRVQSVFEFPLDDARDFDGDALRDETEMRAAQARHAELDATYQRGVDDGRVQGELAERARLRGATIATESALDEVRAGESRWLINFEENIAAVAIAVAQQLVTRELTTATDVVADIVTRAVQEFSLDQPLSIRVNPSDLEALASAGRTAGDDTTEITVGREARWVSDPRIESGGCVVEGRERIVDGRVDTALERLYRRLAHSNA